MPIDRRHVHEKAELARTVPRMAVHIPELSAPFPELSARIRKLLAKAFSKWTCGELVSLDDRLQRWHKQTSNIAKLRARRKKKPIAPGHISMPWTHGDRLLLDVLRPAIEQAKGRNPQEKLSNEFRQWLEMRMS
jgi:hypothetical protein